MKYLCTFGSGWDKAIKKVFKKEFTNYHIEFISDGIIIFNSTELIDTKKMFFFNNVYLLLKNKKVNTIDYDKCVNEIINGLKINYDDIRKNLGNINDKSFKFISIDGNQPCKLNYRNLSKLEMEIQKNLNLKVSKSKKHDLDFVFLRRNDGNMYLLLKLSYNRTTEKDLEKGALRPEVSYLLSFLANIKENDIILDPFTGSGAIPKEIIKHFKYNMIFASELDEEKYNKLKKKFKGNNKKIYIKNFNALNMNFFEDNFIDTIVTDPPWNIYERKEEDYTEFYLKMLQEMKRVVKQNGRLVILMGNEYEFEKALSKINLELNDKLSVLINGKKAKVYILTVK